MYAASASVKEAVFTSTICYKSCYMKNISPVARASEGSKFSWKVVVTYVISLKTAWSKSKPEAL